MKKKKVIEKLQEKLDIKFTELEKDRTYKWAYFFGCDVAKAVRRDLKKEGRKNGLDISQGEIEYRLEQKYKEKYIRLNGSEMAMLIMNLGIDGIDNLVKCWNFVELINEVEMLKRDLPVSVDAIKVVLRTEI